MEKVMVIAVHPDYETLGCGGTICNDVIIGMGSVVTKSITTQGVYYVSPAKLNN